MHRFIRKYPLYSALFGFWLALGSLSRILFFFKFGNHLAILSLFQVLAVGLLLDVMVGGAVVAFLMLPSLMPFRLSARILRILQASYFGLCSFGLFYLAAVEYYFFEEFGARFNYVAVDYLLFPQEVFTNIWQSYPVLPVIFACAVLAIVLASGYFWGVRQIQYAPLPWFKRLGIWSGWVLMSTLALLFSSMRWSHWSSDRTLNELSQNDLYQFFYSLQTASLDYNQYYATLPSDMAWQKLKADLLPAPKRAGHSTFHTQTAHKASIKPNVVFIVMESFGAEFSGKLSQNEGYTPAFDQLASQGLLFSNAFATGNRTIRGLEAILTSFPPLPGRSVVKRDKSRHFFSIAQVMQEQGYQTRFLYGGRGLFDGMRDFMLSNGYEKFLEQKDFADPSFTTAWGVCDDDLYQQSLAEFDQLNKAGKPFFATVLTVSNHKPYTYPKGRIQADPDAHKRVNAVQYADAALGSFFEQARHHDWFEDTVFVIVGDHGARIYGSPLFPLVSYRVPILFYGPKWLGEPKEDSQLASSMDISPTLFGLLGWTVETPFYGRDLSQPAAHPFVAMQHNRDVALFNGQYLVALGLGKEIRAFSVDENLNLRELASPEGSLKQQVEDAIALYQTAYDQYERQVYHRPIGPELTLY
ncbi:MAG: sulfatase-like hydrolase/transferase [Acidobacteria bacterium]|nr:sulfatase-like hydrolase/transferase [Acidobacteriota bacterium]